MILTQVLFLFFANILLGQNTRPQTGMVTYEVLTASVQANSAPQPVQIKINANGSAAVEKVSIHLASRRGKLTLLAADKSGTALWLIKSAVGVPREDVLAWNFEDSIQVLNIYPYAYPESYDLQLELQLNYDEKIGLTTNRQDSLIVETRLPSGLFSAAVSGRGNAIVLNK
jgi:hypothetical protein